MIFTHLSATTLTIDIPHVQYSLNSNFVGRYVTPLTNNYPSWARLQATRQPREQTTIFLDIHFFFEEPPTKKN